mmetsp:Transcript_37524/g.77857  ORF Transcript_37524/g.77857 Transcript_37524/m.77857 type:complete len:413 (-) Transcript_37524:335-1573(-)|eukprot:CAMPEP_0172458820 /NCGR_PEP_ID=MMETSP1065-20121228/29459_1 /TAXON_ID=265537 /ORGANISM="Amphiprora paludosa, Strain CCMP125" /LENGTH=412 /DNA_ID=CAMNT_0013213235 /DNA_START=12 /DNA_END=1250 /DNA_ORIENTATION=+
MASKKRSRSNHDEAQLKTGEGSNCTAVAVFPIKKNEIDTIDYEKTSASKFFENFVALRQPCVLRGIFGGKHKKLSPKEVGSILGECIVEVEKRADQARSFGQNRATDLTTHMPIKELLEKLQDPSTKDLFYLSTQQGESHEIIKNKLTESAIVPNTLSLSGNLILESSNLWMGAASDSRSGLHHDFHDNFYCLHAGLKTFVLYPPTAPIPVYGAIEKIYPNGLISYQSNPTRADGSPLDPQSGESEVDENAEHGTEYSSDEESEEVVIGKGFDYVSSEDEAESDGKIQINMKEPIDDEDNFDDNDNSMEKAEQQKRPDHFSPMDIPSPDANALKNNPITGNMEPIIVQIKAGDGLYLPSSWFHCVFSSSTPLDSIHLAMNYWYHPPDNLTSFEHPYTNAQYWKRRKTENESI